MRIDLDNVKALRELDSAGMLEAAWNLPEQCAQAWSLAQDPPLPQIADWRHLLVTGLGGSAIGGDLLRVFAADKLGIPVLVNRDYTLPWFVNRETLVFAVSYSGNTEETLSAYGAARERGTTVVAITTGGELGRRAADDGVPVVRIPTGIQPRAATGYLFIPMLGILERLGLLFGMEAEVTGVSAHLRELRGRYGPETPARDNPAKQLAANLQHRLPVIWGATGTTEVVAQRWKGQFNENAKAPAYWNVFPELNHNEVVGFEQPEDLLGRIWLIVLRDEQDHPRVRLRMKVTREMVKKAAGWTEVDSSGPTGLARVYSLIYLGDYASMYLAALAGIDPGPVQVIDFLKNELAKHE
ncbi:MAG: bifunctional phosphoglucose/phosphomannose isomerase [Candidatus Desulforudis sp.]|nr:bifunctional phosphoglucose/phosphomannose isomerase [Desulforudis sp.]